MTRSQHLWRALMLVGACASGVGLAYLGLLNTPGLLFHHHITDGRLSLYSDEPIDPSAARALLRRTASRMASSPLDDGKKHTVVIASTAWRRGLVFANNSGAAGVNYYPLGRVVFLRRADVAGDRLINASGSPAEPPRTLTYYAAHELTHSLTGEHLGARRLWNRELPQWVREGYADYVGLGGEVDVEDLYRRWQAGDPELSFQRSHTYAEFRLLAAYMLERQGWTVDQLLGSKLSRQQAQALMLRSPP